MKSVRYEKGLIERLKDPEYAFVYLTEALNDGDQEVIRIAFQDVINAKGLSLEINVKAYEAA